MRVKADVRLGITASDGFQVVLRFGITYASRGQVCLHVSRLVPFVPLLIIPP